MGSHHPVLFIAFIRRACLWVFFPGILAASAFAQGPGVNCDKPMKPGDRSRIATALPESSYSRLARFMKESGGADVDLCATQGTIENLRLLQEKKVDFAIVQGDLMHKGWSGEAAPEQAAGTWNTIEFDRLFLVRRLYSEKLQIVAGPHSYVRTVSDLRKKRVWLGPKESGNYATGWEVLRAAGLAPEDVKEEGLESKRFADANTALTKGKLDAIFRVTAVPIDSDREEDQPPDTFAGTLTHLFQAEPEARMISLDEPLIDRILQAPSYVRTPVYRNSYPGQENGIMTIGVEALLITRLTDSAADAQKVRAINKALEDARKGIQKHTNISMDLLHTKLDAGGNPGEQILAKHAHPAAQDVLLVNKNERYYIAGSAGGLAILLVLFSFRSKKALETLGGNSKYIINGGLLAAACVLFGVALWYYEGRFSFDFHNPLAATEALLVYFARGLKTEALTTEQGQLTALLALAVIATLVHSINSDALDEGVSSWSKKLSRWFYRQAACVRPDERHYVILNWDERAAAKAGEWMKDPLSAKCKITIVSADMTELPGSPKSERIEILRGDPKSLDMLEKARVQDSKLVLIISVWTRSDPFDRRRGMDVELADNYTIRAIHAIRSLEWRNRSTRIVPIDAEIYLESNWPAAHGAGGTGTEIRAPKPGFHAFGKPAQRSAGQTPSAPN